MNSPKVGEFFPTQEPRDEVFDVAIVGAGVSGSFIAMELMQSGLSCVMIEAGENLNRHSYPRHEGEANSRLFWSGGVELNTDANLALLRPKVVGGGSVVNQALIDRFDDDAWDSWKSRTGISWCTATKMEPWYLQASKELEIHEVPEKSWNENVRLFQRGFEHCGYRWAPLKRAQSDCAYDEGTDCIECLSGCRRDSKQSMPVTTLKKALNGGLKLIDLTQVDAISEMLEGVTLHLSATGSGGGCSKKMLVKGKKIRAKRLVLAAGAIGNSALLLRSGYKSKLPALGERFFVHPQEMLFGIYDHEINAFKGGFQALKSDDKNFRKQGFKLENIFAPPASVAMLFPGWGDSHRQLMQQMARLGCLEVAVRDTAPGRISVAKNGKPIIQKSLNEEDKNRRALGVKAIENILLGTGAKKIIRSDFMIGLHLMGGCALGQNKNDSVTGPDFKMYGSKRIYIADSSVFPDAPGVNPSFTIMAMALKAVETVKNDASV